MTLALAGRAPATFEIKSATLPLVALRLKSTDLARLAAELEARFGDMPQFFDDDPLLVDLAPLQGEGEVDFPALLQLLRRYRVRPVAARGGSKAQMAAAREAGLAAAEDAWMAEKAEAARAAEATSSAPAEAPALHDRAPEALPRGERAPGSTPVPPRADALVVTRPLRSGQQVYARGRDLVVLSMVNPGAEVIADGHIHVYAPLRGKAIAGARGNAEARIFTLCLQPELVAIAGVYRTAESPWPDAVRGRPAQVRLDAGEKLVVEGFGP